MWWMSLKSWTSITLEISIIQVRIHESLTCKKAVTLNMSQRIKSLAEASTSKRRIYCHDFSMCYLKDVGKRDVKSLRWCWTIL